MVVREKPRKYWFEPKTFGYGAGLPISWEGWAALALYTVVATAAALTLRPMLMVPVVLVATAILGVVAARRTRGGWKWRNGSERD
jgi:hypothetical protein